jgi:hypothetical protein
MGLADSLRSTAITMRENLIYVNAFAFGSAGRFQ